MNSQNLVNLLSGLTESFTFRERPEPLHHSLRADYRIATLLLMLRICGRGGRSGLVKLHVLNWASRKHDSRRALLDRLAGRFDYFDIPLRFDPAFNRAVDLARGEGLVERDQSQAISLTPSGQDCVNEILSNADCLEREKGFFGLVGKRLTDAKVNEMINPKTIW
ncbi:MAG: hypothetical protein ABI162_07485 [Luteolibacter sp.]